MKASVEVRVVGGAVDDLFKARLKAFVEEGTRSGVAS
jgi:hypothetical protein